jgi:hypothetical protein
MRIKQRRDIGRTKTDQIVGLWDTAFGLLEDNPKQALSTMAKAWALHRGDKLEWSTASVILHAYVQVLNFNGQHKQALALARTPLFGPHFDELPVTRAVQAARDPSQVSGQ